MSGRRGITWVVVSILISVASALGAAAQIPDKFTNLTVLPKDIGRSELVDIMRNFSGALGVRCKFCHVGEDPNSLAGYDFASDKPEHKKVARGMMKLVQEINGKLLPAAGLHSPPSITCKTCHRGVTEPEMLDDLLLETAEEKGVPAAIAKYKELREQYYGSGSYDFGPGTLNEVAETLAEKQNDVDGAIELVKLNIEMNPDAAYGHVMLGRLYATQGDKEAAKKSLERALELEPDNGLAQRMLARLQTSE